MNLQTISQWNQRDFGFTPGEEMEKLLPLGFDLGSVKLSNKGLHWRSRGAGRLYITDIFMC